MTSSYTPIYDQHVVTRTYHYSTVTRRQYVSLTALIYRVHLYQTTSSTKDNKYSMLAIYRMAQKSKRLLNYQ